MHCFLVRSNFVAHYKRVCVYGRLLSSCLFRLHVGSKLSDLYKARIERYVSEYEKLSFSNNFNEKLKEIIKKAMEANTNSTPTDKYVQCNVCHQSCANKHAHERENYELYEKMFHDFVQSVSLEQIIGLDIWNWKAVEKTSIYAPIWNAHEKWNHLSKLIQQLQEPVRIVIKSEQYWTLLIDKYEQNNLELLTLPTIVAKTKIVNYLPDSDEIKNLKGIFDKYDQEEEPNLFSKFQNNDQRTESGYYYLFDKTTTTNKYIDRNDFYFLIVKPPSEICNKCCYNCQKSFSLFTRHHYCRMCGQQHCADCLLYKRIPHLGYITKPVRICHKCSEEKKYFIYQHLFNYVKQLIQSNRLKYLNIYLALLYQYQTNGNESFYQQTGEDYYQKKQYLLALQCFTYAQLDNNEWLKYSIDFCRRNEYAYSLTCMNLCEKPIQFLLEHAISQHNTAYTLLCCERIKISIEQLFEIATQKLAEDVNTCIIYLLYLNIKHAGQVKWKEFGERTLIKSENADNLAMFCFHLHGKMQNDEWIHIGLQLCKTNQFDKLAYMLSHLYGVQKIDLRTSKNSYIHFLTKILLSSQKTISLDDWLNDICNISSFDIDHIIIGLSNAHIYKYTSWVEYKNQYIQRKEYFKALLCQKMAEYLDHNNETRWFINGIEDLEPIAYELFNNVNRSSDWKQLADQYFKDGKFIIALNCYLFCGQNKIDQIIEQAQSSTLSISTALLYYSVLFKLLRGNNTKVNH